MPPPEPWSPRPAVACPGDLAATASATIDGNPSTAWSPGEGITAQTGSWLDYAFSQPQTVDHLDLQVVTDAEHSAPTSITVSGASGSEAVTLPALPVTTPAGSITTVPVSFPAVTGTDLRITFTGISERDTPTYQTSLPEALPIAIAEVGLPGVAPATLPSQIPDSCRSDLLQLDGHPIWVAVTGSASAAVAGDGLGVSLCGPDQSGIHLAAGTHRLTATDGSTTGIDLDQLVLGSPPGVLGSGQGSRFGRSRLRR